MATGPGAHHHASGPKFSAGQALARQDVPVRILFTSFPAYGHLHPVVPLALAALAAGHDVRLATGPDFAPWVERCGLPAVPVGLSQDEVHEVAAWEVSGPEMTARMFTQVWVPAAMPGLLELAESWRPELVVHEEQEYAGVLLASRLGLPCVTHSWSAPARPAGACAFQLGLLEPVWAEWLPEVPARRLGELYLDACPPQLQASDLAAIASATRVFGVRPGIFDGPASPPPAWLAELPRPAAYVTRGTVAVFSTPDLLRHTALALAPLFSSVVVTTGPNPVASLGALPANVLAVPYLAQSLVLPSINLVVSHGGAGGTLGALMAGLPHLVLPGRGMSQITSAAAVERIGAGLSLPDGERDRGAIGDAAERLLSEPEFAAVARRVRAELAALPGPEEVLAGLVSTFG
jgi:UDP:flavonoid glycosyltransferase YjiC (YdhE family)